VDAVETVFDAQRQRTRHLPAALVAERLISLLVGLFHGNHSLANPGATSNAAVNPVMPAPMIATDSIQFRKK
jgi:hypothetical protein